MSRDDDGSETAFRGTYREIAAKVTTTSIFHTTEERDGMLGSGVEGGLNETYARRDELLAKLAAR